MPEAAVYRMWCELEPEQPRWYWWLVEHRLTLPTKRMWLRLAEDGVRAQAAVDSVMLVGDPIGEAVHRDGRVVVRASALAIGPDDKGD